jgi:hypothetical protein
VTPFEELVRLMVDNDLRLAADEADLRIARDRRAMASATTNE